VAKVKPDDFKQAILLVHERQAFILISRQELDSEQHTLDLFDTAFAPGHENFP
jgi:PHD/YefM family antitoxin component YafN of YafNO toxin-antitoxin module